MSKFIKAAMASSVLAASVMGASAANAATASADARANILQQVTVTNTSDLDFATIVAGAAASTVVVAPVTGTVGCGVGLVCSGTTTAAGFSLTGTTGETVTIATDPSVTLVNGTNSMTASLLSSAALHVITGVAATDTFSVGGTLSVGAGQADGAYLGSFNVTVNYQ
ncbi:DUF4402 domain-containing protein [Parasphingorhabdus sp.]|uniref:DUF4402 domain-containing protein n=1 Tax=Parasphingorhabdus sp. TaxID=2709688 RepID=UPI003C75AB67